MKYLKKFETTYSSERKLTDLCFENFAIKISNNNELIKRFKRLKCGEFYNYLEINKKLGIYKIVALIGENKTPVYYILEDAKKVKHCYRTFQMLVVERNAVYNALKDKYVNYKFQKEFLENKPLEYKKIEEIGFAPGIEDEFSYLWNASDMGLLESLSYKGKHLFPFRDHIEKFSEDELKAYWKYSSGDIMMGLNDPSSFSNYNKKIEFGSFKEKKEFQKTYIDPFLKEIIGKLDVNVKSKEYRRVPLIPAMHLRYYEVVKELLRNGSDISIKDGYGDAPIDCNLGKEVWDDPEVQDLVLKYQPQNYKLLMKRTKIDDDIKKKYDYLFDGENMGLL